MTYAPMWSKASIRTDVNTLCRRARRLSASLAQLERLTVSNPLETGNLVICHLDDTRLNWYPVLDSNQPVRVRSAESSS